MNSAIVKKNWFEEWFDSPYYGMLYEHRSTTEAVDFIDHLIEELNLSSDAKILDLACGRGRHAVALAKKGFDVTGVDLSAASIQDASEFESEKLHFYIHDMRRPVAVNYFDAVFNLFTSFGYFSSARDNHRTLDAIHTSLKKDGVFVLDYFNPYKVKQLVLQEPSGSKLCGSVKFEWTKEISGGAIVKKIHIDDNGKQLNYGERVQLFTKEECETMLRNKFEVKKVYGDYRLGNFDPLTSERLIFICTKKQL